MAGASCSVIRCFGKHKTWRGLLVALLAATALAPMLGLASLHDLLLGVLAMLGDLASSFIKRRLGLRPGSPPLCWTSFPRSCCPCGA